MSIIYLYVKQHSTTGLKYFGKTVSANPFKYKGSGRYWNNHCRKHGWQFVKTIELWGFDDQDLCTEFALRFSEENDITDSPEWANLILENGLYGGVKDIKRSPEACANIKIGRAKQVRPKHTEETKRKMSEANKAVTYRKPHSEEANRLKSLRMKAIQRPEDHGRKISEAKKGKKPRTTNCPHCGKHGSLTTMKRWHFDNCPTLA